MQFKLWLLGFFGNKIFFYYKNVYILIVRAKLFLWSSYSNNKSENFLSYLTAAVVLSINSRKRKTIERDIVKVIEQEEYAYQDPITEFILW